jgi:hypothetical protein
VTSIRDQDDWTSLRQALIWLKHGTYPLHRADEVAVGEWEVTNGDNFRNEHRRLLLLLRNEQIAAEGFLTVIPEDDPAFDETNFCPQPEWDRILKDVPEDHMAYWEFSKIPGKLWKGEFVDWDGGVLHNHRGLTLQGKFEMVRLNRADLLGHERNEPRDALRIGRPPEYDWEGFYAHLVVLAHYDGLPEKQSHLIKEMQEWCQSTWGKEPALSSIKGRIRAIYKHPRMQKGKKSFSP